MGDCRVRTYYFPTSNAQALTFFLSTQTIEQKYGNPWQVYNKVYNSETWEQKLFIHKCPCSISRISHNLGLGAPWDKFYCIHILAFRRASFLRNVWKKKQADSESLYCNIKKHKISKNCVYNFFPDIRYRDHIKLWP